MPSNKTEVIHVRPAKIIALIITILSGIATLWIYAVPYVLSRIILGKATGAAGSVGIIGGADGPTAVFVSKLHIPYSSVPHYVVPVVFVLSLISWLLLRHRLKKK